MVEECGHDQSLWEQRIDFPVLEKQFWNMQFRWIIETIEETPPACVEAYLETDHPAEICLIPF